jgi:hypothetical protein
MIVWFSIAEDQIRGSKKVILARRIWSAASRNSRAGEEVLTTTAARNTETPRICSAGQTARAWGLAAHLRCVIMARPPPCSTRVDAPWEQLIQRLHSESQTVIVITHFARSC